MQAWMMTIPICSRTEGYTWGWLQNKLVTKVQFDRICSKRLIRKFMDLADVKQYIIAKETGKNGLEHWQIRLTSSDPDFFDHMKEWCEWAHVEKAATEDFTYERKEGHFWTSEDTVEILQCRFAELGIPGMKWQQQLLKRLRKQSVREIDVVLDPSGNRGKSFFTIALWERGEALVVPRYQSTAERLSGFVCSAYKGEWLIVMDIPRSTKPTKALYETMEEVKDGLVFDHRYSGKTRNVRGVKLVVFTNEPLNLKGLSGDRWKLHGIKQDGTLS